MHGRAVKEHPRMTRTIELRCLRRKTRIFGTLNREPEWRCTQFETIKRPPKCHSIKQRDKAEIPQTQSNNGSKNLITEVFNCSRTLKYSSSLYPTLDCSVK